MVRTNACHISARGACRRARRGGLSVPVALLVSRPGREPAFSSVHQPRAILRCLSSGRLVHLLFLAPDVTVFSFQHSWLVRDSLRTQLAYTLLAATIGAFALLGLAVWETPGLSAIWPVIAIVAAALSTVLLVLFWNWQLGLGVVINAVLVASGVAWMSGAAFSSTSS